MTLRVGDLAPDFTLPSSTGGVVRLSDVLKERAVVLYFYPKDETPGCTAEACAFRDSYEVFKEAGAEVIGVSDDSAESHRSFAAHHRLPFLLLADEGGAVRQRYGVNKWLGLLGGRVTFVIDRQGIVQHVFDSQIQATRHVDEALATLSAAQDLADITAGLTQNPLPDAWVVQPQATSREELARVADDLGKLPGVAETHLDSQWADRLQAALAIGRTGVWLLAGLFAIALIAISGNAIRAQVLARRDEIHDSRLIGATDRYIRRPFLYLGALQGLLGGLAAGGVLAVAGGILRAPVERLAGLYGSAFHLLPPTGIEIVAVLGLTTLFGWIGAWLSVTRALQQVEAAR